MSAPDRGFAEVVLAIVDRIPAGQVMSYGDVAAALDAAHEAFKTWGKTSATDRSNILLKIADRMEQNLDLLARAELMRCAAHAASLQVEPCAGFEAVRADAAPPERALKRCL